MSAMSVQEIRASAPCEWPGWLGDAPGYTALIRTFNSASTLPATLRSLAEQAAPPDEIVIVDSGSTDHTLKLLPSGVVVHHYVGERFNYSDAINQGLAHASQPYVLVISSHTALGDGRAVRFALELLQSDARLGAAYFSPDPRGSTLSHHLVDARGFDGFNGLHNTCALIRSSLLQERAFRSDVFSAEDQEWTAWLLATHRDAAVARIDGARVRYNNPHKASLRKRLNEYLAVAMFVRRDLLDWKNIARVAYSSVLPSTRRRCESRWFYVSLALHLVWCRFARPTIGSRYF